MGLGSEVGTRWPAHATATGKVLLSCANQAMTEPMDGLHPMTAHTITSWETWTETLSEVRRKGYATNIEELEYGFVSVAAPILDREGLTTASLSVGGTAHRITTDRIPGLAKSVQDAAARVSERLGYRSSD